MTVIILLSVLIVGSIVSLILYYLFNLKQKKISKDIDKMLEEFEHQKLEVMEVEDKLRNAIDYLNEMKELDAAVELENKIRELSQASEEKSKSLNELKEELEQAQQKLIENKNRREESRQISLENIDELNSIRQNNESLITTVSQLELEISQLINDTRNFIDSSDNLSEEDKIILYNSNDNLEKMQNHLISLSETYITSFKRLNNLEQQYKELEIEFAKLSAQYNKPT